MNQLQAQHDYSLGAYDNLQVPQAYSSSGAAAPAQAYSLVTNRKSI